MSYSRGDHGKGVEQLQKNLQSLGINLRKYGADGRYEGDTQDFVTTLQTRYNQLVRAGKLSGKQIEVDGVAGPETLAVIERLLASEQDKAVFYDHRTLSRGDLGPDVEVLQEQLIAAGYPVEADGKYGPATERAVKAFQRDHGLEDDGHWGQLSRGKMATENPRHQHQAQQTHPATQREREPVRSASRTEEGTITTARPVAHTHRSGSGYGIISPVAGPSAVGDDYHASRSWRNAAHRAFDVHATDARGRQLRANEDRDVVAALPGEVAFVHRNAGAAGNVIGIISEQPDGRKLFTAYSHLNDKDFGDVRVGQRVYQGQTIARLGATGNATKSNGELEHGGTHVHFAVYDIGRDSPGSWNAIVKSGKYRAIDLGSMEQWGLKRYEIVNGATPPVPEPQRTRMAVADVRQFIQPASLDTNGAGALGNALHSVQSDPNLAATLAQMNLQGVRTDDGISAAAGGMSVNRISGTLAQLEGLRVETEETVTRGHSPVNRQPGVPQLG